jgi:hypothetical protein
MADPPKKKGALMALLSFGGKSSDKAEPEDGSRYSKGKDPEDTGGDSFSAAADSLFNTLGVPDEKRDSARAALKTAIGACMSGYKAEEPDEDDEDDAEE